MYYFCTYFDQHYLSRGLALYRSLKAHCPAFRLWVLCMDERAHDILTQMALPEVQLIRLEEFEEGDEPLLSAKQNRTRIEYYFTCTPSLPLFVLNHWDEVDLITYLDADLFFFADPAPIYEEMGQHSIAIIGHRFPPHLRHLERTGIYNVGWLSFKRDKNGLACLRWWRERCIEWCYDKHENGRYADQKYLDQWPTRFQNVIVLQHKGANLAPWNLANYKIKIDGKMVLIDSEKMIFFHFQGLKQSNRWLYNTNLANYKASLSHVVRLKIYSPYIQALSDSSQQILPFMEQNPVHHGIRNEARQHVSFFRHVARQMGSSLRMSRDILFGRCLFVVNGQIL